MISRGIIAPTRWICFLAPHKGYCATLSNVLCRFAFIAITGCLYQPRIVHQRANNWHTGWEPTTRPDAIFCLYCSS
jgi:hypothetical protein